MIWDVVYAQVVCRMQVRETKAAFSMHCTVWSDPMIFSTFFNSFFTKRVESCIGRCEVQFSNYSPWLVLWSSLEMLCNGWAGGQRSIFINHCCRTRRGRGENREEEHHFAIVD